MQRQKMLVYAGLVLVGALSGAFINEVWHGGVLRNGDKMVRMRMRSTIAAASHFEHDHGHNHTASLHDSVNDATSSRDEPRTLPIVQAAHDDVEEDGTRGPLLLPKSRSTTERCSQMPDESEVCFYDGPLCYDGERVVVFTDEKRGDDGRRGLSYDFRHHDVSYTNSYGWSFGRPGLPKDTPRHVVQDDVPRYASYGARIGRTWGPVGREVQYREESPDLLTPAGLRAASISILWLRPGLMESVGGMDAARSTWVRWNDLETPEGGDLGTLPDEGDDTSGLYIPSWDQSWITHTFHGAAAMMALWDVKRYNRTGRDKEGYKRGTGDAWAADFAGLQRGPGLPLRPMGAWAAPPMDHLIIAGQFPWKIINGLDGLYNWFRGVFGLLQQNHTKIISNEVWRELGVDKSNLLCARRTVVTGYKPRIFTSIGDAYAWRLATYASLNLPNAPKEDWPPRAITILTRPTGGRSIHNLPAILEMLRATGLDVTVITDAAGMSFKEQVEVMANTGIFIGAHGAGLQNAMFLPGKAVLIEMFPYVSAASAWRDVAASTGIFYYSMRSQRPPIETSPLVHSLEFKKACDGWTYIQELRASNDTNKQAEAETYISGNTLGLIQSSSLHGFLSGECFSRSKLSSLLLREDEFGYILAQAMDDIGCKDGWCYSHPGGLEYSTIQQRGEPKEIRWVPRKD